jgi:hypothetical protein
MKKAERKGANQTKEGLQVRTLFWSLAAIVLMLVTAQVSYGKDVVSFHPLCPIEMPFLFL